MHFQMKVKQVGDITPGHNHADLKSFNELVENSFYQLYFTFARKNSLNGYRTPFQIPGQCGAYLGDFSFGYCSLFPLRLKTIIATFLIPFYIILNILLNRFKRQLYK